jgi:hypothetical protein
MGSRQPRWLLLSGRYCSEEKVDMAVVVSALVGALLAVLVSVGVVTVSDSAKPAPVDKPLIVYGQR